MKHCGKCNTQKPIDAFGWKLYGKRRHSWCKECYSAYKVLWYEKNKVRHKSNARKRANRYRKELTEVIRAAKDKPCVDCGIRYNWWIMQFDHLDPSIKKYHIAHAMRKLPSIENLKTELSKCDVVCANCHADRTHKRRIGEL